MDKQVFMVTGRVGRESELRYTAQGTAVANFTVAYNPPKRGQAEPETQWYSVTAWGKLAETVNPMVTKGRHVLIVGEIKLETYKDRNDIERVALRVNADSVTLLDKRPDADGEGSQDRPARSNPKAPTEDEEDIPF